MIFSPIRIIIGDKKTRSWTENFGCEKSWPFLKVMWMKWKYTIIFLKFTNFFANFFKDYIVCICMKNLPSSILVDFNWTIKFSQLFFQQLKIWIDKTQFQSHGFSHFFVGSSSARGEIKYKVYIQQWVVGFDSSFEQQ